MTRTNESYFLPLDADSVIRRHPKKYRRIQSLDEDQRLLAEDRIALSLIHVETDIYKRVRDAFIEAVHAINGADEGTLIAIYGESQSGKTHILKRLMQHEKLQPKAGRSRSDNNPPAGASTADIGNDEEGEYRPLLMVRATAPGTQKGLGWDILCALKKEGVQSSEERKNNPVFGRTTSTDIWNQVRALLEANGTSILIIDEIHSILVGDGEKQQKQTAAILKSLVVDEDWPMTLVLAGVTDKTTKLLREVHELGERAISFEVAPIERGNLSEVQTFVQSIEAKLPFDKISGLCPDHGTAVAFWKASQGYRGRISRLLRRAAWTVCNKGGECVTIEDVEEAYKPTAAREEAPNWFEKETLEQLKADIAKKLKSA